MVCCNRKNNQPTRVTLLNSLNRDESINGQGND